MHNQYLGLFLYFLVVSLLYWHVCFFVLVWIEVLVVSDVSLKAKVLFTHDGSSTVDSPKRPANDCASADGLDGLCAHAVGRTTKHHL